jgi:hypothetical protein
MNQSSLKRYFGVLVLLSGVGGSVQVLSQSRSLPDAPGTWKPWKPLSTTTGGGGKEQAATPAVVKAFEGELLTFNAILRRATGVASPVGFSVETWGHLAGYHVSEHAPAQPAAGKLPIAGGLTFGAFPIFEYQKNGKTVREDTGETALQTFLINQIDDALFDRAVADWASLDTDAFQKPMRQGEIAGLPRYDDGLIIARDPEALWTPLPQRGALDLVAKARQLVVQGYEESVAAYTARLAVVRDPAYRAKRVAEAKEGAAAAKMPNPQAFIKQVEDSIGVEEASLLKEIGPATGTGKNLADAKRALSEVTDWIAQLSPGELAAPSCYAEKGTTLRDRFPTVGSAGCRPLVRPNYGYFNAALPRSAPQVVIITGIKRCFDTADKYNVEANSPTPSGCRANRALIETMDKDAIRGWLR